MKEFDLEAAKAGAPVQTRNGFPVRIVCFDYKSEKYPILGLIDIPEKPEMIAFYSNEGKFIEDNKSTNDLFMAPQKKYGWINIYKKEENNDIRLVRKYVYDSEEIAIEYEPKNRVATIKIEWEE